MKKKKQSVVLYTEPIRGICIVSLLNKMNPSVPAGRNRCTQTYLAILGCRLTWARSHSNPFPANHLQEPGSFKFLHAGHRYHLPLGFAIGDVRAIGAIGWRLHEAQPLKHLVQCSLPCCVLWSVGLSVCITKHVPTTPPSAAAMRVRTADADELPMNPRNPPKVERPDTTHTAQQGRDQDK